LSTHFPPSHFQGKESQTITIQICATEVELSRIMMTRILNLFTFQVMSYKLEYQDLVQLNNNWVPVNRFDEYILRSELEYKTKAGAAYHLFDLVPEKAIATYGGRRFNQKELNLPVWAFFFMKLKSISLLHSPSDV
jgi:hypothetical protein